MMHRHPYTYLFCPQVAFWKQSHILKILKSIGAVAATKGWSAGNIFKFVAGATTPDTPGLIDLDAANACAPILAKSPTYSAFTVPISKGGSSGLYFAAGTPESERTAMLSGKHRPAFTAVVRETQVNRCTRMNVLAPMFL